MRPGSHSVIPVLELGPSVPETGVPRMSNLISHYIKGDEVGVVEEMAEDLYSSCKDGVSKASPTKV